ncbi:hypothetical protein LCGC14_1979420, partial [marine sediment metagenome]
MPYVPVGVKKLKNGDGSYTLSLTWRDPVTGSPRSEKSIRTEPKCGVRMLKKAYKLAREDAHDLKKALSGERANYVPIQWNYIPQAKEQYLLWSSSLGPGGIVNAVEGTITLRQRHIESFLAFMKTMHRGMRIRAIHHVALYHIAQWRDSLIGKKLEASTINNMISSVSGWFMWAVDHGFTHNNPCEKLLRPKMANGRAVLRIATPQDLIRTCEMMPDLHRSDITLFLGCTGLRIGEFRGLQHDSWNEETRVLTIPETGTERTKLHGRDIPLCIQGADALRRLLGESDGPYICGPDRGRKALTSQINAWMTAVHVRPHDLRRFFIFAMESIGTPSHVV